MKKLITLALLVIFLAGCTSPAQTPTSSTETSQSLAAGSTAAPTIQQTAGSLVFTLTSPEDNSTVATQQIDLIGSTSQDAVLSVNDAIFVLKAGPFTQTVSLEDGLNILQIVASNDTGDEVDLMLSVTYASQ